MKVELLGSLDYNKVRNTVTSIIEDTLSSKKKGATDDYADAGTISEKVEKIIKELQELETDRRAEIVSSAGRLSRFAGSVFDVLGVSENKNLEQNSKFIDRVVSMGHSSITDHDYLVFAIEDVSPVVEQTIIEERFSSFTIKSRREVDFSNVGFYVPDFHDKDGNVLPNSKELQEEYKKHMQSLFDSYQELVDLGIPREDARFVLPYSYHSNIIMGMDAHSLMNLIIKLTKTHLSKIQELREFGEKLYEIAKEKVPYIIPTIDRTEKKDNDPVVEYIDSFPSSKNCFDFDYPELIGHSMAVDNSICLSSMIGRKNYSIVGAITNIDSRIRKDKDFVRKLIEKIALEGDGRELAQVEFGFIIPISLASLTHLTRHRTHDLIVPGFVGLDLEEYVVPPSIYRKCEKKYRDIYKNNNEVCERFKQAGVCPEDLVHFALSGTMTNCVTNFDGKTLMHISRLRECNKAQWEIRNIFEKIHKLVSDIPGASIYASLLGAPCDVTGICPEGKECCGKVYSLPNCKM